MNTAALKTFAPAVRKQIMEAVTRKLDYVLTAQTPDYLTTFAPQVASLRKLAQSDRAGLIERAAYTWFNRLAALRFMDARSWHPFRARVLTPATADETQPELLKLTRSGTLPEELKSHTDPARLNDLLDGRISSPDAQGEVYRHLILAACRFYHALLPNLFEKLDDETELLLPDDVLTEHSVVHGFRTEISDADCVEIDDQKRERANVEILGWLYQFYISERKDAVMARKSAVPTEDIPAVTQLFTPHWIVRYLVENSLGRLWLLNHPDSRLREHMPYYIEGDRGQGAGGSLGDLYDNTNLQGLDRLAEVHGLGRGNLQAEQSVSEGGTLRADQSTPPGGGVSAFEHRGGTRPPIHSGVQELPFDRPGIAGRGGDATTAGHPLPLPDSATGSQRPQPAGGNLQNAGQPTLKTVPCSLTPDPSAARQSAPDSYLKIERPEDIKLLDPACGSAHMLTYAFDLLFLIYEEEGYAPTEIPGLILRHNLHGLEICPRAAQLAELALVFKAREKSRRFFQPEHLVRPRIIELRDVRFEDGELPVEWLVARLKDQGVSEQGSGNRDQGETDLLHDLHLFTNAKNFGSLLQPKLSESQLRHLKQCATDLWPLSPDPLFSNKVRERVLRALEQAEALTQRYHVVVANPPYMGGKGMNGVIKQFLQDNFTDYKSDLFAGFIVRSLSLSLPNGFLGFMSPFVWMFISSYEKLRARLISQATITTLVQLEYSGFDGATVPICAFSLQNQHHKDYLGGYVRLSDFRGSENQGPRTLEAIANRNCGWFFRANSDSFRKIPGSPIAYWATAKMLSTFDFKKIDSLTTGEGKNVTSDNSRFVRLFWEVNAGSIGKGQKWLTYAKGGAFRKWQGNLEYVVDWSAEAHSFYKQNKVSRVIPRDLWYRSGITWTDITSSGTGFRYLPENTTFDATGITIFLKEQRSIYPLLGLLNSTFAATLLPILNPTFHAQLIDIKAIPVCDDLPDVVDLVAELVSLATKDWDNFETSWDFQDFPLLRDGKSGNREQGTGISQNHQTTDPSPLTPDPSSSGLKGATLEASWRNWEAQSTAAIRRMQELETENNRLFIAAYGLDGELQPEVPEEQITLARAEARRDMAAFLSYAVGCMMGRFSLHAPGLILADAGATLEDYARIVAAKTGNRGQGTWNRG